MDCQFAVAVPPRPTRGETGVQFAAMAYYAYRAAKQEGCEDIPTDWFLQDIKP